MNATPPSPKDSYGPRTAGSSSADSPNPQPHNAQAELSRQPLRSTGRVSQCSSRCELSGGTLHTAESAQNGTPIFERELIDEEGTGAVRIADDAVRPCVVGETRHAGEVREGARSARSQRTRS